MRAAQFALIDDGLFNEKASENEKSPANGLEDIFNSDDLIAKLIRNVAAKNEVQLKR